MCHAEAKGIPTDFSGARRGAPHEGDDTGAFYVKDCAAAIQLIQSADKLAHRAYNISAEQPMTYKEFAETVRSVVPDAQIGLLPGRSPQHRANAYLDISRIKDELGYRQQYSVRQGIEEYIDWLRRHPE
jgi:UDP-glucose 4-epimerase